MTRSVTREVVCPTCCGLGVEMQELAEVPRWANTVGWSYEYKRGIRSRQCQGCNGHGVKFIGQFTPIVPMLADTRKIASN